VVLNYPDHPYVTGDDDGFFRKLWPFGKD